MVEGQNQIVSPSKTSPDQRPPVVVIVDNDQMARESLADPLVHAGLDVVGCASAAETLKLVDPKVPGCFLIDVGHPEIGGAALRQQLLDRGCYQPFIAMSGNCGVSVVVGAFRSGAFDYLVKPFDTLRLVDTVCGAIRVDMDWRKVQCKIDSLTRRERELLPMIAEGKLSKEVSKTLGISQRTVEVHRRHIMRKMGANSVARLVRVLTDHYHNCSRLAGKSLTLRQTLVNRSLSPGKIELR